MNSAKKKEKSQTHAHRRPNPAGLRAAGFVAVVGQSAAPTVVCRHRRRIRVRTGRRRRIDAEVAPLPPDPRRDGPPMPDRCEVAPRPVCQIPAETGRHRRIDARSRRCRRIHTETGRRRRIDARSRHRRRIDAPAALGTGARGRSRQPLVPPRPPCPPRPVPLSARAAAAPRAGLSQREREREEIECERED
uniref:Uncharacterized protein n=1 Tax=Oryza sativa subsp. japonica TaxID=39947 RepID=Q5Z568_ORYSJ|nr:hypothetical protein [Oryza sativa Japonica Group]